MAWGIDYRLKHLRRLLAQSGAIFPGHPEDMVEFVEFVINAIPKMPEDIQGVMRRYYIFGDTQMRSEDTGLPDPKDSRFYQQLATGRACLITLINEGKSGRAYRILERKNA